ncbi:hypothetical protein ED312_21815 [Sinomicrobium pectinilyticum]|uniref:Peptidase M12A domain-containing protein n=1 Tax=Sinomicrobium pectinilyticum TaxID=1084421 RepID=A0A3N0DHQ6_SINP1|nr:M12 family metallopeptidase [Sinomicrobium pectinilyticum]RNL75224.1 hypothetical protein ED312_21815 [Sinomicrobium pectinilyticum]
MKTPNRKLWKRALFMLLISVSIQVLTSCSKEEESSEPLTEIESKEPDMPQEEMPVEEAFPGYIGEVETISYLGQKFNASKHGDHYILEGDVLLAEDELNKNFHAAGIETGNDYRWTDNVVYYTINPRLPDQDRVTSAIAHWENNTNLRFVERTDEEDYIEFIAGSGCYSTSIGKKGGRQFIGLSSRCSTGNTIHEIGHAVGFFHEQTREDRDNHIIIHWDNIQEGRTNNFQRYSTRTETGRDIGNFDFGSIMMYPSTAFSIDRSRFATITRIDSTVFAAQRNGLSETDIEGADFLYPRREIRINSGSTTSYTDDEGEIHKPDIYYTDGEVDSTTSAIANTISDSLFQSYRSGNSFSYSIIVPNRTYQVQLKFMEPSHNASELRVFDVRAEGEIQIDDLDIYASTGERFHAIERSFTVEVSDGYLDLEFEAGTGDAIVSGIVILQQ